MIKYFSLPRVLRVILVLCTCCSLIYNWWSNDETPDPFSKELDGEPSYGVELIINFIMSYVLRVNYVHFMVEERDTLKFRHLSHLWAQNLHVKISTCLSVYPSVHCMTKHSNITVAFVYYFIIG